MNIDGKTKLIGLLGWPVSHTKSPAIHNALSKAYKQNLTYVPLPVHPDGIEAAVRGLSALGFVGVNVTVPHKQAVMPYLDEIDPAADAIGAVNTILFEPQEDGSYPPKSIGYNTDWLGLKRDLDRLEVDFRDRDCLVFGAGGSARAVVYMLLMGKARVRLLARRLEQAEALCQDMRPFFPHGQLQAYHIEDDLYKQVAHAQKPLIINTTPLGMDPYIETSVWPDRLQFPAESFIYDLVYTPAKTKLVAQALSGLCQTSSGLGMLLGQGAESYRIWTGIDPDIDIMERALKGQ